jgi:DNA-binding GntR family transcriptional regulator
MSPTFQKIEPVSKKTRIVAQLKEAVIAGTIRSGEQIVEGKIAQQFGVGQGLIREALIELEHQGFVQRTPFAGTQVSKLTMEDAQQIFEIRIELEPLAFFLAGLHGKDSQLAELKRLADQAKSAARAQDLEAFFTHHLNFRKNAWKLSGNKYLQQTLERIVVPLYALYFIRLPRNMEGILQTTIDCVDHQDKILSAYDQKNFEEARRVACVFLTKMKGYLGTRLVTTE